MGAAGIGCHPLRNDTTCVLTPEQLLQAQRATWLDLLDPVRPGQTRSDLLDPVRPS